MNKSIKAAFATLDSKPAGSSLFALVQQLQQVTGIGRESETHHTAQSRMSWRQVPHSSGICRKASE